MSPTPKFPKPRNYKWPDATDGNWLALRHGAYSPRKVDPLAEELVTLAIETVGYLDDPSYSFSLWAWARAEARVQLLTEYLAKLADEDVSPTDEVAMRADDSRLKWERRASDERDRLGLNPTARARLEQALSSATRNVVDIGAALSALEAVEAQEDTNG